jgi:hypothetical protein
MSGMNEFLAQYYGTNGASPEVEKTASEAEMGEQEKIAMFAKLAKDNEIDISSMSDEKIEQLFRATFAADEKTAGELPPQFQKKDEGEKKDDKKDEKSEEEKKAAAEAAVEQEKKAEEARLEKQAQEADFMGRVMAHAYVNEMRKIAASAETAQGVKDVATSEPEKTASLREKLLKIANADCPPEKKDDGKKDEKKDGDDKGKSLPPWLKDKEASASLEDAAAQQALSIVQEYNKTAGENAFDVKVAAERINAVHTLGLTESAKVASAENVETAVGIRALEYLEAAGYPVQWTA